MYAGSRKLFEIADCKMCKKGYFPLPLDECIQREFMHASLFCKKRKSKIDLSLALYFPIHFSKLTQVVHFRQLPVCQKIRGVNRVRTYVHWLAIEQNSICIYAGLDWILAGGSLAVARSILKKCWQVSERSVRWLNLFFGP